MTTKECLHCMQYPRAFLTYCPSCFILLTPDLQVALQAMVTFPELTLAELSELLQEPRIEHVRFWHYHARRILSDYAATSRVKVSASRLQPR